MPDFNRGTGLLVIEVRNSNPNGDPDQESDPRTYNDTGHGLISPVSFKRKLRDLVAEEDGAAMELATEQLGLGDDGNEFGILESRGRDRKAIEKMDAEAFTQAFWDGRVFGNTFLESIKGTKKKPEDIAHFISTGTVQIGLGVSLAPVEIERMTQTNKSGVQEGKDRGMAPLGFRVVRHGLYTMPLFVNPMMARKNGCTARDIALLKFLLPHAYSQTASASRPFVSVVQAWYVEHKNPLGSCPDPHLIDALTPTYNGGPTEPSQSLADYELKSADDLGPLADRIESVTDLCESMVAA